MSSLLAALLVASAPVKLAPISAPLGHLGGVVEDVQPGGVSDSLVPVIFGPDGCTPRVVALSRFLGGAGRALEQLQRWMDSSPGFEASFFKKTERLSDVMRLLSAATPQRAKGACRAPPVRDGFKPTHSRVPKSFCASDPERTLGEYWFFSGETPAAVIRVAPGTPEACAPRISSILFDSSGAARLRLSADWGGEVSAELLGDRCQLLEFRLDEKPHHFLPRRESCKSF
jgi:hypothetical protein